MEALAQTIEGLALVDHHCHGLARGSAGPEAFQMMLTEAHDPLRDGESYFDTPLGIALRRLCPPVLGLPAHAGEQEYLAQRGELGDGEVARLFMSGAGLEALLVDTGFAGDETSPADLGELAGCSTHTVHRVETIAEDVLAQHGDAEFLTALRARLESAQETGVAFKSIVAYRGGLGVACGRPRADELRAALARYRADRARRLTCPTILRHVLCETLSVAAGSHTPIQFHVGYGDNDLDLRAANPLHLRDFIQEAERLEVPVVLLHCYPYHREAGYLAAAFPTVYFDIGLTIPHVGLGAERVLAESLELAPFAKLLYSSDAVWLPELFFLAARLFREAAAGVFGRWVADGAMTEADARRFVTMIGSENARRVYPALRPGAL